MGEDGTHSCRDGPAGASGRRARTIRSREVLTEQLQSALNSRVAVGQAKGVLARTRGVGVDGAFDRMRNCARANHYRLSDVAREVVADPTLHRELITAT